MQELPELDILRAASAARAYRVVALADYLGVSSRHLRRLFSKQLGRSPQSWLREERLQAARTMLLSTASIKQIAYALSYRQVSQFCRDFKKRFACSPSEWVGMARRSTSRID